MRKVLMSMVGLAAVSILAPVSVEAQQDPGQRRGQNQTRGNSQEKIDLAWKCEGIDRLDMTLNSTIVKDGKRKEVTAEGYLTFKNAQGQQQRQGMRGQQQAGQKQDLSGTLVLNSLTATKESGETAVAGQKCELPFTLTPRGVLTIEENQIEQLVEKLGEGFEDIELAKHLTKIYPPLPEQPVSLSGSWEAKHDDILFKFHISERGQVSPQPRGNNYQQGQQQQGQQQQDDQQQGNQPMDQNQSQAMGKNVVVIIGEPVQQAGQGDKQRGTIEMRFDKEKGYVVHYHQDTTRTDSGFFGSSTCKIQRTVKLEESRQSGQGEQMPGRRRSGN